MTARLEALFFFFLVGLASIGGHACVLHPSLSNLSSVAAPNRARPRAAHRTPLSGGGERPEARRSPRCPYHAHPTRGPEPEPPPASRTAAPPSADDPPPLASPGDKGVGARAACLPASLYTQPVGGEGSPVPCPGELGAGQGGVGPHSLCGKGELVSGSERAHILQSAISCDSYPSARPSAVDGAARSAACYVPAGVSLWLSGSLNAYGGEYVNGQRPITTNGVYCLPAPAWNVDGAWHGLATPPTALETLLVLIRDS